MNKELDKKIEEAMMQITNFCEECGSHDCCPEEECVLWRIEQTLLKEEKNE